MFSKKNIFNPKLAFSLIEISVVVLIIGILISSVSAGVDLYSDYKITIAKNLTKNSIVGRLDGVKVWYETTLEESFVSGENLDGVLITRWNDIKKNQQMSEKYHAYGAQRSNSNLFNYETNYISKVSGPKFVKNGINGLPTLNFKNNYDLSMSQFIAIDQNLKMEDDNFDIFMVVEFKFLSSVSNSARTFLIDRVCTDSSGKPVNNSTSCIQNSFIQVWVTDGSGYYNIVKNGWVYYYPISNSGVNLIKKNSAYLFNVGRKYNDKFYHYRNGKLMSNNTETGGAFNISNIKIGRMAYWNGAPGDGTNVDCDFNLSELIIVNSKISDSQKSQIEEYLAKKYNIKLTR